MNTATQPASQPQAEPAVSVLGSSWPSCFGRTGCMAANVEHDAASDPDGEAARVLDYEPMAICEDCPVVSTAEPADFGDVLRVMLSE